MRSTFKVIFLSDDSQLIMQLDELLTELQFCLTAEYLLKLKLTLLIDGHERTVRMRVFLVQMNDESKDVILPIFLGQKLVHVLCPVLDVLLTSQMRVVFAKILVEFLVTESQVSHLVTRTAENQVDDGTILRMLQSLVLIPYATPVKIGLHPLRDAVSLVNLRDDTTSGHFKVQMLTGEIIVPLTLGELQRLFCILSQMFGTLRFGHAFLCLDVKNLICHNYNPF